MPNSIINADSGVTSGTTGLVTGGGDTGVLEIQTNGVTAATVDADQVFNFVNPPTGVPTATIASTAEAEAGTNNTNFITPLRMREGFNASGSAPVYAARAWVNFNGTTTTPTIRASGNVSSVTRNSAGVYTVNFTTAMPDANYSLVVSGALSATNNTDRHAIPNNSGYSTTSCVVRSGSSGSVSLINFDFMHVAIFR
jgi:hypothetical protein